MSVAGRKRKIETEDARKRAAEIWKQIAKTAVPVTQPTARKPMVQWTPQKREDLERRRIEAEKKARAKAEEERAKEHEREHQQWKRQRQEEVAMTDNRAAQSTQVDRDYMATMFGRGNQLVLLDSTRVVGDTAAAVEFDSFPFGRCDANGRTNHNGTLQQWNLCVVPQRPPLASNLTALMQHGSVRALNAAPSPVVHATATADDGKAGDIPLFPLYFIRASRLRLSPFYSTDDIEQKALESFVAAASQRNLRLVADMSQATTAEAVARRLAGGGTVTLACVDAAASTRTFQMSVSRSTRDGRLSFLYATILKMGCVAEQLVRTCATLCIEKQWTSCFANGDMSPFGDLIPFELEYEMYRF